MLEAGRPHTLPSTRRGILCNRLTAFDERGMMRGTPVLVFGIFNSRCFLWACREAGIEDFRFHDLRHEATSRLLERGLNQMEVASITGHRDLRMLKRYTHLRPETLPERLG